MLTNDQKIDLVDSHLRNLAYNKYNLQLSLIEENSITPINESTVDSLEEQISIIDTKVAALEAEKALLTE